MLDFCAIKIKRMLMASSTDFKNLWKRYQKEGVSKFISHVRAKFKLAADIAKDEEAAWFVEQIGRLYLIEAECLMRRLTLGEIRKRRKKSYFFRKKSISRELRICVSISRS